MLMSYDANLEAALALAAHGVPVFPCNSDKKPRPGLRWKEEASTEERRIREWWRRWPNSLPAFCPGAMGWLAIDLDGAIGLSDWEAVSAPYGPQLDLPATVTPGGGRHLFFLNPKGLGNSRGDLPKKRPGTSGKNEGIDVRGKAGYVIAEGATLPDGRCYQPAPGSGGLLEALSCQAIPQLPAWLEAILSGTRQDTPAPQLPAVIPAQPRTTGTRERAAFDAALDAERLAVARAGAGTRNETLNTSTFNLATMVGAGWGDRGTVEAVMTAAAHECGLRQPEVRKTIASAMASGLASPRAPLADREGYSAAQDDTPIAIINGLRVDAETGEVLDDPEDDEDEDEPPVPLIDEALTHVPGVLGELIDWIADCSSTGNRLLALSAALPVMATVLGRRMATPTRAGGNLELYVIATMDSGAGKADQRAAITRLFECTGLHSDHLARAFASGPALSRRLCDRPLTLSVIDEISDYFEQMFGGASHLAAVASIMKEVWGYGFSLYSTDAALTREKAQVHAPTWSIYGMTTNEDLFRVVKTKEVTSGFINRFLMIDAGPKTRQKPTRRFPQPATTHHRGHQAALQHGRQPRAGQSRQRQPD
jgi:hypothetical protein